MNKKYLTNEAIKPTMEIIKKHFSTEDLKKFFEIKNVLSQLGELDFLWRGQENGWVLTLKDSSGKFGSVILSKDVLIGQMAISRKELISFKSDPEIEGKELLSSDFYWAGFVSDFLIIPLKESKDITSFISLVKAKIKYNLVQ